MLKYGQPIWKFVLNAACEIDKEVFSPRDIIQKIHKINPKIPATSIRAYVIAMAPNHPSSHHYPTTHKKHRYFEYLGSGKFKLLKEKARTPFEEESKPFEKEPLCSGTKVREQKSRKDAFLKKNGESIIKWTEKFFFALISGRRSYSWNDKPLIECLEERNKTSSLIVSSRIKNNGGVDVDTLDRVMSWGGFPPFPIRDNEKVLRITSRSFKFLDEQNLSKAIFELLSVKGVGISSASKIIGLFDQNRFIIYDSRVGTALRTLKREGERIIKCPAGRTRKGDVCSPKQWAENYEKLIWASEIIRNRLNEHGYPFSISDVEMALFMIGKCARARFPPEEVNLNLV